MMRIHDRLVLRLWLQIFSFCILGFVILLVLGDWIEKMDNYVDHHAGVWSILRLYGFQTLEDVRLTLPVDVLLATLFTFGILGRNNEIVALLASGVSLLRVALPVLTLSLGCVGLSALLAEHLVPEANARAARIKRVEIEKLPPIDAPVRAEFHYRGSSGYFYFVRLLDTRTQTMSGVILHQVRDGRVVSRLDAQEAVWRRDHWEFRDGVLRTFPLERGADDGDETLGRTGERTERFHILRVPELTETPEDLARIDPDPKAMNFRDLRRYVHQVQTSGGNPDDYIVDLYTKVSYPWTSFVLAVLGVALSASKRKPSLATGFGLTILICFTYLGLTQIGAALGKNERLPPLLAAWIGNLLFGTIALVLVPRVNR